MPKFVIECLRGRNQMIDADETKIFDVKDFAEATALLKEDLSTTASDEWSASALREWKRLSKNPRIEELRMVDRDVTWVFRYEGP
jgi:hypothetical protein